MTFQSLGGTEDCGDAFLFARPPYSSSGLGGVHSPTQWPKSEFWFCPKSRRALFPSDMCVPWVRRIDHLSDPRQSTTPSWQVSAKIVLRSVQFQHTRRIVKKKWPADSIGVSPEFSPIYTGQFRRAYSPCQAILENKSNLESVKRSRLLGAGVRAMYMRKLL